MKPPDPYPDGDPCGIVSHWAWCRCELPGKNDPSRYCPGEPEYERVRKVNAAYRESARKNNP